jgi:hypothetical protein
LNWAIREFKLGVKSTKVKTAWSLQMDNLTVPEPDSKDKIYNLITGTLSLVTLDASGLYAMIMKPPIDKRLHKFLQGLANRLMELQQKVEGFSVDNLSENEKFISGIVQLTQIAISTHEAEKLEALRNAALNSALPQAPDDIRQKMFIQWLNELTPWHWKILPLFEHPSLASIALNLGEKDWIINNGLSTVRELIEKTYPEMEQQGNLYIQIIRDLHLRGLVANYFPFTQLGLMTKTQLHPVMTSLAKDFLKFIESPFKD